MKVKPLKFFRGSCKNPMSISNAPVIEVRDVSHSYGQSKAPALDHINLSIAPGEFVAFIGQNGAGKTTLAKMLNGTLIPSVGNVMVQGHNTREAGLDVLSRLVGFVYQNPDQQIFSKTVREEVAFGPRCLGLDAGEVEKRVGHALRLLGMEKDAETYPFLLGRGQRQKLAVAAVIAMGTSILVVDEPTTGLDLKGTRSIMNLLSRWNQEGRSILIITHDMNIVAEYATRAVVMAESRVLADGPTREVLTDVDILKRAYLEAPQITRVSNELNRRFSFPKNIMTVKEFYDEFKKAHDARKES
jgi:energy-coupling factor transporter ATP-binding protein EcfA2